jgi:hypothetical protein
LIADQAITDAVCADLLNRQLPEAFALSLIHSLVVQPRSLLPLGRRWSEGPDEGAVCLSAPRPPEQPPHPAPLPKGRGKVAAPLPRFPHLLSSRARGRAARDPAQSVRSTAHHTKVWVPALARGLGRDDKLSRGERPRTKRPGIAPGPFRISRALSLVARDDSPMGSRPSRAKKERKPTRLALLMSALRLPCGERPQRAYREPGRKP